ncbi:MAG: hypothetical protein HYV09_22295 [Deltaproteobacteria bacterium]|nr:hypothetical protein [Deltaproteobacteria bacterium]
MSGAAFSPEEISDLAARFRHARRAALRAVLADANEAESEETLLARALAEADSPKIERRVFENCLALGEGFARFYGATLSLADLPGVLPELDSPCLDGVFAVPGADPALTLLREGCSSPHNGRVCSYWREAIQGLVLGVTGGVITARHESRGGGNERCVDVFHVDPLSPRRFGPIPDDARDALAAVHRLARAFDSSIDLDFLGINESVLHYRVRRRDLAGDFSVSALVERSVRRLLPHLSVREVTDRAVLAAV